MVLITKGSGEKEEFDAEKIKRALLKSGATQENAEVVVQRVESQLYSGISTKKIFQIAFSSLKKLQPHAASRYDLRNAILRLGPAGYPFETFVARVMEEQGYSTSVHNILRGACVSHEVDVVASREGEKLMVECKFHNKTWIRCHVQTALYTYARFLDLVEGGNDFSAPMLATNTKFSDEVISYGECKGMKLLGWSYPKESSLQKMIESKKLYPVTVLGSADARTLEALLQAKFVVLKDLLTASPKALAAAGLRQEKAIELIAEARGVCSC
ncbi:MAG: ATP cone domain-containing protein [Candidatus Micrarchaeia archaeon]